MNIIHVQIHVNDLIHGHTCSFSDNLHKAWVVFGQKVHRFVDTITLKQRFLREKPKAAKNDKNSRTFLLLSVGTISMMGRKLVCSSYSNELEETPSLNAKLGMYRIGCCTLTRRLETLSPSSVVLKM